MANVSIEEIIKGLESIKECSWPLGTWHEAASEAIALLKTNPAAQPNEPLTLEELREMDGKPVWVESIFDAESGWALLELLSNGNVVLNCFTGERWELMEDGGCDPDEDAITAVYRYPPKEFT